jgi:hypothetical protein
MDEERYPQQLLPLPIRSGGLMVMSSALGGSFDGRHPPAAAPRSPLTIRPLLQLSQRIADVPGEFRHLLTPSTAPPTTHLIPAIG